MYVEKEIATNFSFLAWRIPRTEEPGRLQPMKSQKAGYYWVHTHTHTHTHTCICIYIYINLFIYIYMICYENFWWLQVLKCWSLYWKNIWLLRIKSFICMFKIKDLGRRSNSVADRTEIQNYISTLRNNSLKLERIKI